MELRELCALRWQARQLLGAQRVCLQRRVVVLRRAGIQAPAFFEHGALVVFVCLVGAALEPPVAPGGRIVCVGMISTCLRGRGPCGLEADVQLVELMDEDLAVLHVPSRRTW